MVAAWYQCPKHVRSTPRLVSLPFFLPSSFLPFTFPSFLLSFLLFNFTAIGDLDKLQTLWPWLFPFSNSFLSIHHNTLKYWTMSSLTNSCVHQLQNAREMPPVYMITLSTCLKLMASLGVLISLGLDKATKTVQWVSLVIKVLCNQK